MKRAMILVLLALLLAGCGGAEDPYRVDTVVYIPADPTQTPTEIMMQNAEAASVQTEAAPTEAESAETEPSAVETELPETEPEATEAAKKSTTGKKSTSSKKNTSGKKDTSAKATEPPTTESTVTEPPVTEMPVTEPPATQPPATEAPAPEPPAEAPPATEPEPTAPPLYDISGYSVGSLEKSMKDAINAHRSEAGLSELSLSSRLSAIASCRSYEISQVWSHTRPDGRSYKTVLSDYGYGGSAQELLVYVSGSGDGAAIIEKWMNSDSHKELLLGGYSTVGIGIYRAGGYTYVTCLLVG